MISYDNANEITFEMSMDQYRTVFEYTDLSADSPYTLQSGNIDGAIVYNTNTVGIMCGTDPMYSEQYQNVLLRSVHFEKGSDVVKITLQAEASDIQGIKEAAKHCGFKFAVKGQENG